MSDGNGPSEVRRRLEERYLRLARARRLRPIAAIVARFAEIEGGALGTMVSVQLFTTVIPLMIKGFSYMTGFADNASPGTVFIRELGLVHPTSDRVRSAFGESAGLRSSWTFLGVAGFLVWDIPMAITIAGIFAKAWHREPFGFTGKLWPGGGVVRALPDDDRSARPHRLRRRPPRRDAAAAVRGVAGARLDLLVGYPGAPGPRRWLRPSVPPARRPRRCADRRHRAAARLALALPAGPQRLGGTQADRCRDGAVDLVRCGWNRLGGDGVRRGGAVGAQRPVSDGHRVADRDISRYVAVNFIVLI